MIHTKAQLVEKLNGLETYVKSQKGRVISDIEVQQVHQFVTELKTDLVASKK